jgi:hypothetical protein
MQSKSVEDTNAGTNEFTVHPKLLMDRDALFQRLKYVHDYIGKEYQDEQLKQMMEDPYRQNYKKVLQHFVKEELHQEITSFQTISETVNPRWMAVITEDNRVYKVSLKKWNDYNRIWTITSYAELHWKGYPLEKTYELLTLKEAPEEVKEWVQQQFQSPKWKTASIYTNNKTYALIKTSSEKTDSVELDHVETWAGEARIRYQKFQYDEPQSGLIDYLLIKLKGEYEWRVVFDITYTNSEK